MTSIADQVREIIEPYVGAAVSGMCLRAAAADLGKDEHALEQCDIPTIVDTVGSLMRPVAPAEVITEVSERLGVLG